MLAKFSAEKLRNARTEKNITQEKLAEQAGLSVRYLRALEDGDKYNPSASYLCRISLALSVPMDKLMDISGEDASPE